MRVRAISGFSMTILTAACGQPQQRWYGYEIGATWQKSTQPFVGTSRVAQEPAPGPWTDVQVIVNKSGIVSEIDLTDYCVKQGIYEFGSPPRVKSVGQCRKEAQEIRAAVIARLGDPLDAYGRPIHQDRLTWNMRPAFKGCVDGKAVFSAPIDSSGLVQRVDLDSSDEYVNLNITGTNVDGPPPGVFSPPSPPPGPNEPILGTPECSFERSH